jgi:hypothetical protein
MRFELVLFAIATMVAYSNVVLGFAPFEVADTTSPNFIFKVYGRATGAGNKLLIFGAGTKITTAHYDNFANNLTAMNANVVVVITNYQKNSNSLFDPTRKYSSFVTVTHSIKSRINALLASKGYDTQVDVSAGAVWIGGHSKGGADAVRMFEEYNSEFAGLVAWDPVANKEHTPYAPFATLGKPSIIAGPVPGGCTAPIGPSVVDTNNARYFFDKIAAPVAYYRFNTNRIVSGKPKYLVNHNDVLDALSTDSYSSKCRTTVSITGVVTSYTKVGSPAHAVPLNFAQLVNWALANGATPYPTGLVENTYELMTK